MKISKEHQGHIIIGVFKNNSGEYIVHDLKVEEVRTRYASLKLCAFCSYDYDRTTGECRSDIEAGKIGYCYTFLETKQQLNEYLETEKRREIVLKTMGRTLKPLTGRQVNTLYDVFKAEGVLEPQHLSN